MSKHGKTAIYEHIGRGDLQIIKSGAKTLIPRPALIRWMKHLMQVGSVQVVGSSAKATLPQVVKAEHQRTRMNAGERGEFARDRPHSCNVKMAKPVRAATQESQAKIKKRLGPPMLAQTRKNAQATRIANSVKKVKAAKKRNAAEPGKSG